MSFPIMGVKRRDGNGGPVGVTKRYTGGEGGSAPHRTERGREPLTLIV